MSKLSVTPQGIVVLVHGFNKRAQDMEFLRCALDECGWHCVAPDLPTLFGDINACVAELSRQLAIMFRGKPLNSLPDLPVHFVCHSMGGLIVREFISRYWQQGTHTIRIADTIHLKVSHCVFIATPHQGSRLADYAVRIPGYKRVFKPVDALLPDAGYQPLPANRGFRLGLIAGNKSGGLFGNFLDRPNDGHVEVKSVHAKDADACIELPYPHKKIHHQRHTLNVIDTFLRHGLWDEKP